MQVIGEYRAVQTALLQITKKLRDGYFPSSVLKEVGEINHLTCAVPDIGTYRRAKNTNVPHYHTNFNRESISRGMNHLRISNRTNGHLPRQKKVPDVPNGIPWLLQYVRN